MARKSLAEIRTQLKKDAEGAGKRSYGDGASYPFWNIPLDSTAVVRFLPDADDDNVDGFWVERLMINLDFSGIVGDDSKQFARVQVPCVEMYGKGNTCPVQAEIKPWYNDASLEEQANKYWKKRSYLYQGFVMDHPGFVDKKGNSIDDNAPENPIRRFVINPGLHKTIRSILLEPELEAWPDDYDAGLNFNIRKTQDGKWASYDQSSWARRESSLNEEQREAIEKHGLWNLREYLPKQPTEADLKVILEMFEASVDGEKYDPERWGQYYRPAGMAPTQGADNKPKTAPKSDDSAPAPKAEETTEAAPAPAKEDPPFEADAPAKEETSGGGDRAADILARIKARKG